VGCTSARPAREGVDPDWTYRDAGGSLAFSSVWDEDAVQKPVDEQVAIAKGIDLY